MSTNEIRVALIISDFECDPDQITQALGVRPDKVYRRGDSFPTGPRRVDTNVWRLQSGVEDDEDLDPHVESLLGRFPADLTALESITPTWKADLAVAVHVYGSWAPYLGITGQMVQRLARLGAALDMDVYCLAQRQGDVP